MPQTAPQDHPGPLRPGAPIGRWLVPVFYAALALVGAILLYARALHPGPSSGEFWSDSNVINASRGFDRDGLAPTWGLPRIQSAAPLDNPSALYLTYPPGPYWITYAAWTVGKALGLDPLLAARLFAQVCGIASAFLLFLVFKRLAHSRGLAALGALFYILSPPFLSYSAALHHMTYSPLLLFAAMLCWLAFEDGSGKRRLLPLTGAALLFALDCWTNLEHMFFFALFVGARTAFHFRWPIILGAALVGPIPIPMMALRVLHNAQVLGGWDAAMNRLRSRAIDRAGGGHFDLDLADLYSSWLTRLGWAWPQRTELSLAWNREFVYPVLDPWVLAGVGVIGLSLALHAVVARRVALAKKPRKLALSLVDPGQAIMPLHAVADPVPQPRFLFWTLARPRPIVAGLVGSLLLLAGGLTWFFVMTQHTHPHRFIVLLLMPGLALMLATLAWTMIESARSATAEARGLLAGWLRLRAWLLALALLGVFAMHVPRADVLNLLVKLDEGVHKRVTSQANLDAQAGRAGRVLMEQGVTRAFLFDDARVPPRRAAALGVPFVYQIGRVPRELREGDALVFDAWSTGEIGPALDAIERLGLPDLVSPPQTRTLVLRAQRPAPGVQATLDTPLRSDPGDASPAPVVVRLRWAPTLLGDQFALSVLVAGDLGGQPGPQATTPPIAPTPTTLPDESAGRMDEAPPAEQPGASEVPVEAPSSETPVSDSSAPADMMARYVFILRVLDAQGKIVHDARTRLRWSPVRDARRALVVLVAPAGMVTPDRTIEFSIWDRVARAPVPLRLIGESSVRIAPSGQWLRWSAGDPPDHTNVQPSP